MSFIHERQSEMKTLTEEIMTTSIFDLRKKMHHPKMFMVNAVVERAVMQSLYWLFWKFPPQRTEEGFDTAMENAYRNVSIF